MPLAALALVGLALVPRVVVLRDGSRTVLSVQSEVSAPWPLPAGVTREGAASVPASAFDEIDRADVPTLGDSWEGDPCPEPQDIELGSWGGAGAPRGSLRKVVDSPPGPPRRSLFRSNTADGFRVETSAPALVVPVVAGQELVIHVLSTSSYDAVDVPTVALPERIEIPVSLRGSFPELYQSLFERADGNRPGTAVREYVGYPNLSKASLASLGYAGSQPLSGTRLHLRPAAGTTQVVLAPSREPSRGWISFEVVHPWPAPIRCVDPERGVMVTGPAVPLAAEPTPPTPTADALLRIEVPALGLHAAPWWRRLPPFDDGALVGGGLGLCAALLVRRRSPP